MCEATTPLAARIKNGAGIGVGLGGYGGIANNLGAATPAASGEQVPANVGLKDACETKATRDGVELGVIQFDYQFVWL